MKGLDDFFKTFNSYKINKKSCVKIKSNFFFGFFKKIRRDNTVVRLEGRKAIIFKQHIESENMDDTYHKLLTRFYDILKINNPELKGEKKLIDYGRLKIETSPKKTKFTNFKEICKKVGRSQHHLMQFISYEMDPSVSLDGKNRLIVKKRFEEKDFAKVLRSYISEYVLCKSCKLDKTKLIRDPNNRLTYITCCHCGASRAVTKIKGGFQARAKPRKVTCK